MLKLLKNLGKREYIYILICIVLMVFQVWLDLKLPDFMTEITKLVQMGGAVADIVKQGSLMLGCAFGSLIISVIISYFATFVAGKFGEKIRSKVFNKVLDFSMEEIKEFSVSSLITRTTNDVGQVQMLIGFGLQALIKAPIMAVWAVTKIAGKNLDLSKLVFIAVLSLLVLVIILIITVLPKFKIVQKLTDNLNRITRENLTGIRVVRAFNAEDYQQEKFEVANKKLTNTQLFNQKLLGIMWPYMSLIMSSLTLGIYFVGATLINEAAIMDKITIFSDMVVFSSYAMQVIMSFIMLVMIFLIYPRASVSAKRIREVLDKDSKIKDGEVDKGKELGTIEFKNVAFKYPDADDYVIKDINFKIKKGETVAFIGSTGSGKSTLINLIPRFYDATEGSILVDGVDVKDYKLESLNNKLGYVSQKAVMFAGSVKENVTYGSTDKKILDEDIEKAIRISQAEEFVLKMDDKYDSFVARGGTNVSGGQKQRLSIARAIARKPEIYIFDDTFSALDYKTDYKLRKELHDNRSDATTLIVASRIGTIMNADKIIVLDKGKIVGMGTHHELLKKCQVYKEIATSQLSEEELA